MNNCFLSHLWNLASRHMYANKCPSEYIITRGKAKGKGFGKELSEVMNMSYERGYKERYFNSCRIFIILVTTGSFIDVLSTKNNSNYIFLTEIIAFYYSKKTIWKCGRTQITFGLNFS